jgi:hypothetical protein
MLNDELCKKNGIFKKYCFHCKGRHLILLLTLCCTPFSSNYFIIVYMMMAT